MVEQSAHEAPLVAIPTSTSSTSSQGVDLYELERLRVLVRFEFDREATRDELITALTRCHNNTREAYHLLKEQRRQQQLAASAAMVAAAATTATGGGAAAAHTVVSAVSAAAAAVATATGASNTTNNGTKRRSEDDGDVEMDTPTKRQRAVEEATVDLSQEDDDAEMTQVTQLQLSNAEATAGRTHQSSELLVDKDLASCTITDIVSKLLTGQYTATDESEWPAVVGDALIVQHGSDLDHQLVVVVEALANTLQHVESLDVAAVQGDGVTQIMQVLLEIPRLDQYNVALQLSPSDEELNTQLGNVENAYAVMLSDELTKSQRADAAKNAITMTTDACASCIARQESIRGCIQKLQAHYRKVRNKFDDREKKTTAQLDQARRDVESTEREMNEARDACQQHGQALMEVYQMHRDSLIDEGYVDTDVFFEVNASIVLSQDPSIVQRRRAREQSHELFRVRKQEVMRANTRLEFYQKLHALLDAVKPRAMEWLNVCSMRTKELRVVAVREVEEKLKSYLPKLTQSLRLHYEFHTMRQGFAKRDCEVQEKALLEHEEYYGDLAPSTKQAIKEKIREFNGVTIRSTQQMREVASLQRDLWEGKQRLFSPGFFAVVESEYRKLWENLAGGAKDMMRDCVKAISGGRATAPLIGQQPLARLPPSAHNSMPVVVAAGVKLEVTGQYQFVSRLDCSQELVVVRGSMSTPTSPVVDLTGDADDDEMDGGGGGGGHGQSLTGRVDFDIPSTRITSAHHEQATNCVEFVSRSSSDMDEEEKGTTPQPMAVQQRFPVGSVLFSRVNISDDETPFFRCQVKEVLDDDKYVLVYDEGDEYTISSEYLFTKDEMDDFLRPQDHEAHATAGDGPGCTIM